MNWDALAYVPFAAAALLFTLAGWLAWVKFQSPVHRGFALFLLLRGLVTVADRLAGFAASPGAAYWRAISLYFFLALVPTLAYFLVAYTRGTRGAWRGVGLAILAFGVLVEIAYLLDHCLARCTLADGRTQLGPLAVLAYGAPLAYGAAATIFASEASRAEGSRRHALFLASVAFGLNALVDGGIGLAGLLRNGLAGSLAAFAPSPWALAAAVFYPVALLPAAAALVLQARAAPSPGTRRASLAAAAAAAACGAAFVALPQVPDAAAVGLVGFWRLASPALVAYALLRHRLLDMDVKIRWTIRQGTLTAIFVGVFLVVTQVAENFLDEQFGLIFGGIAAGLLLLALQPLQRLAERVADVAVPAAGGVALIVARDDALRLYRDQAAVAWADGFLGRGERAILDQLRERLSISYEEASQIETEVARGAPVRTPPP